MNKLTLLLPITFVLNACFDDNDFDVLRSSDGIDTNEIHTYVYVESHTHIGETAAEDDTHTTFQTEFYGYDRDGYTYVVELSENDQLSVTVDGETRQIEGLPLPSAKNKAFIEYIADFEQIGEGSRFEMNLDRNREAGLNTIELNLLGESPFTASPEASSELSVDDNITLEWPTDDTNNYRLHLRLRCFAGETGTVLFPIKRTHGLTSPATISVAEYFDIPADNTFSSCEMHSVLQVSKIEDVSDSVNFASATTKNSRQQAITHNITLNQND